MRSRPFLRWRGGGGARRSFRSCWGGNEDARSGIAGSSHRVPARQTLAGKACDLAAPDAGGSGTAPGRRAVCCSGLRAHAAPADLTGRELGDGWPLHLAAAFSLRPPDLKGTGFITTETLPRVSAPCFRLVEFKTNYGTSPGGNCEHRASPLLRPPPPRPSCRTVHLWPAAPPQATRLPTLWRQRALGTPRPAAPSPSTPALQETLQQERDIFFFLKRFTFIIDNNKKIF